MTFATRLRPRYRAISQNIGKTFQTRKASLPGGIRKSRRKIDFCCGCKSAPNLITGDCYSVSIISIPSTY
jgi:hypothetical protein